MTREQIFNLVCFCILMENDGGILDKSPRYIQEKFEGAKKTCILGYLDQGNINKALQWAEKWLDISGLEIYEQVKHDNYNIPADEYHKKYGVNNEE